MTKKRSSLQQRSFDLRVPEVAEPDPQDAYRSAMEKAGRLLARRQHSEKELEQKLGRADAELNARVLTRLNEMGLVDDEAFARRWVEERSARKGRRALQAELAAKGVDRDIVTKVLDEVAPDEEAHAVDLAARFVRRVVKKPLAQQAGAITQMLVRRGYSYEVAESAAKKVLHPDGWD